MNNLLGREHLKIKFETILTLIVLVAFVATTAMISMMIFSFGQKKVEDEVINTKKSTLDLDTYNRIIEKQKSETSIQKEGNIGRDNPFDKIEGSV